MIRGPIHGHSCLVAGAADAEPFCGHWAVVGGRFFDDCQEKSVGNVLCSSKKVSIFAADFAAHVLLALMLMR